MHHFTGEGSTSTVYTAVRVSSNETVAIKVMNLDNQQRRELLINEVMCLCRVSLIGDDIRILTWQVTIMKELRHDNIVQMYDAYLVDNELWVVMQYLDGGALNDIVTNAR